VAVEPVASRWSFPPADSADEHGVIGFGGDLEPGTLLAAYRNGLFPMPYGRRRIAWFSPDPRGVLPLDGLRVTRSMRRSARRYTTTRDTAFTEVMTRCGDDRRDGRWINDAFIRAYTRLHDLGWASSVESRDDDGVLVGGLYGVRIGGLFAGESMFHTATDASKAALMALVDWLVASGVTLLDVQWVTPHLASLGAVAIPRAEYLRRLAEATR
jgi:leucyl/phenylalanyl-tRNA--protein transferase